MPIQLIKDNVYKYSSNATQLSVYCCDAFTLFQNSIRKVRQVYLTDHAIYIISRKKLKIRLELTSITKVYVGILGGQFFIVSTKSNFIIDCPQGRSKFIQHIKHVPECKIQYVNYTTLDFLFQKHQKINNKIKLTQYDSNQKKVQLKYFTGQKVNLCEMRQIWQQKNSNLTQKKVYSEKDYQLTSLILSNTYWNIFLAKKKDTNSEYTVKIYSKKFIGMQQSLLKYIWNQRNQLINLTTLFIPSLVKSFYTKSHIFIVCDCFNGYLLQSFKNIKKTKFVNLIAQIVIAVGQLHQSGIVYGDVSKNGIMITYDGFVYLFNLGMSTQRGKQITPQIILKPPEFYQSPKAQFSWDWWNLALLIFELVQKKSIYDGKNNQQIQSYLKNPSDILPQCFNKQKWQKDQKLLNLFECLLKKDRKQRIGYKNDYHEILHHKYFQDWLKMYSKSDIMKKKCPPVFKKINKSNSNQKLKIDFHKQYIQDQDWSQMNSYLKDFQFNRQIQEN